MFNTWYSDFGRFFANTTNIVCDKSDKICCCNYSIFASIFFSARFSEYYEKGEPKMRSLWKNNIWLVFLLTILVLLPASIPAHAQTEDRSIVVAIGFDKIENGDIEVSAEIIVPKYQTTYSQDAQIISSSGKNSSEALVGLSVQTGKVIGLSHCSSFLFGKTMQNENIIEFLDQILRGKRVNYNAQLIFTESKARDVLEKSIKIDENFNQNINTIVQFNDEFIDAKTVLLSDFYKNYYDGYGAVMMPVINLSQNEYEGLSSVQEQPQSSSGQSGGGNSQQNTEPNSNNKNQQYLSNNGRTAIFNEGKIVKIIDKDQTLGFGLMANESTRGVIVLENIYDGALMNAELSFSIKSKYYTKTVDWSKNGKPRVYYSFRYIVKLEQVKNNNDSSQIVDETKVYLSPAIKQAFSNKVRQECSKAINSSKQMNLDLFDIYQSFDRFSHKKWQEYLNTLDDKNDYMQDVEFFVSVMVNDTN